LPSCPALAQLREECGEPQFFFAYRRHLFSDTPPNTMTFSKTLRQPSKPFLLNAGYSRCARGVPCCNQSCVKTLSLVFTRHLPPKLLSCLGPLIVLGRRCHVPTKFVNHPVSLAFPSRFPQLGSLPRLPPSFELLEVLSNNHVPLPGPSLPFLPPNSHSWIPISPPATPAIDLKLPSRQNAPLRNPFMFSSCTLLPVPHCLLGR